MMGPGRPASECENAELVSEFEFSCRGGDYEFSEEYRKELLRRLELIQSDVRGLRAVAIGPDRTEIIVGYGTNEELADWYRSECNIADDEWSDYKVNDFPMDLKLGWEDVGNMTLRQLVSDCEQFPCIAGYQD